MIIGMIKAHPTEHRMARQAVLQLGLRPACLWAPRSACVSWAGGRPSILNGCMPPRRPLRCLAPTVVRAAPGWPLSWTANCQGAHHCHSIWAGPAGRIDLQSPGPQPPSVDSSVEEAMNARPRHRGCRRLGRRRGSAR